MSQDDSQILLLENLTLAPDRKAALSKLLPGTEDHFVYSAMYEQVANSAATSDPQFQEKLRHGFFSGNRVVELRDRQLFLDFDNATTETAKKAALKAIENRFVGAHVSTARAFMSSDSSAPVGVSTISPDLLKDEEWMEHGERLPNKSGLHLVPIDSLKDQHQREEFLARASYDTPNVLSIILQHLSAPAPYSTALPSFGSQRIHNELTLMQLNELMEKKPDLINSEDFVQSYCQRLFTGQESGPEGKIEALKELRTFQQRLAPSHRSFVLHVLYHILKLQSQLNIFDEDLFFEYLKLPRVWQSYSWINQSYHRTAEEKHQTVAVLNNDFSHITGIPPVNHDLDLVTEFLVHFFLEGSPLEPFQLYLSETFVKNLYAETMLMKGNASTDDMEKWASMLSDSSRLASIQDQIILNLPRQNRQSFPVHEAVKLLVDVKNIPKLMVKIFEINTETYYRKVNREIDSEIGLDGLVAKEEMELIYDSPPIQKQRVELTFDSLTNRRGVFVIELIGNGQSARAFIRKGTLRTVERKTAAGHAFLVLDENNQICRDAVIYIQSHKFIADPSSGIVLIPYTHQPRTESIVLCVNNFAVLDSFVHMEEKYELEAGVFLHNEQLILGAVSKAIVRAKLSIHNNPAPLSLLDQVTVTIYTTDSDNVPSQKVISEVVLSESEDYTFDFQVPGKLRDVSVVISGKVHTKSMDNPQVLSSTSQFRANQIESTNQFVDLFLRDSIEDGYCIFVLGKNGEPKSNVQLTVELTHKYFDLPRTFHVVTTNNGSVSLTRLTNIKSIQVRFDDVLLGSLCRQFTLESAICSFPESIVLCQGESMQFPYPVTDISNGDRNVIAPHLFGLCQVTAKTGRIVRDLISHLSLADGLLTADNLDVGLYQLHLKRFETVIPVEVVEGTRFSRNSILSSRSVLDAYKPSVLRVTDITVDENRCVLATIKGLTPSSRVHMIATNMVHNSNFEQFLFQLAIPTPNRKMFSSVDCQYLSGRTLGDEYRYVLDRKTAQRFVGNMLAKPELLLKPLEIRDTNTTVDTTREGSTFKKRSADMPYESAQYGLGSANREMRGRSGQAHFDRRSSTVHPVDEAYSNFDFLSVPAMVFCNLVPDESGLIRLDALPIGFSTVSVFVTDVESLMRLSVPLPLSTVTTRDISLSKSLPSDIHFAEHRKTSSMVSDETFPIADAASVDMQMYDTLEKVYSLLTTLAPAFTTELLDLNFLTSWDRLDHATKLEKFNKWTCHELNFFLYKKDKPFFESVVQPFLSNKGEVTFVDKFLLDMDLSCYIKSSALFDTLNVFEQILLASRFPEHSQNIARSIKERSVKISASAWNHIFDSALRNKQMEDNEPMGHLEMMEDEEEHDESDNDSRMNQFGFGGGAPPMPCAAPMMAAMAPPPPPGRAMRAMALKSAPRSFMKMDASSDDSFADIAATVPQPKKEFYRSMENAKEWAETHYYKRKDVSSDNITSRNAFWADWAEHIASTVTATVAETETDSVKRSKKPFLSPHFGHATSSIHEILLAVSCMDLPFQAVSHKIVRGEGRSLNIIARSACIVFHKEVRESQYESKTSVLVGQKFIDMKNPTKMQDNERVENLVDEFLINTVYTCQIVVTNVSTVAQQLEVLVQIPEGSLPVGNGSFTKSHLLSLPSYQTSTVEYKFYFPHSGRFNHYPVHVSKNGVVVAFVNSEVIQVGVNRSVFDENAWHHLIHKGDKDSLLRYLDRNSIVHLDIEMVGDFLKNDANFFQSVLKIYRQRFMFSAFVWRFGFIHNDVTVCAEYLRKMNIYQNVNLGYALCSSLLSFNALDRGYRHLEYGPLVNPRAHRVGNKYRILNSELKQQYIKFLQTLTYKPAMTADDILELIYYLLLQDRIEEALKHFARISNVPLQSQLQFDYLAAYLDFYSGAPNFEAARSIVSKYTNYPVIKWRRLFQEISQQLTEYFGQDQIMEDVPAQRSRDQKVGALASSEPDLWFTVESTKIQFTYQNLSQITLKFYCIDVEILFSRAPFQMSNYEQFSYVLPNLSQTVSVPSSLNQFECDLPQQFHNSNVYIEASGEGLVRTSVHYSNSLRVNILENHGQVKVADRNGKPLSQVYVKCFAKMRDGQSTFYRDGYTDIRGRFDYASLNTGQLNQVERFALLVVSDELGSLVRESAPPKQ